MVVVKNPDGTYLLTPSPGEAEVITWALANHSSTILEEVVTGWLRGELGYMRERKRMALKESVEALTEAERDQIPPAIRRKLGLP